MTTFHFTDPTGAQHVLHVHGAMGGLIRRTILDNTVVVLLQKGNSAAYKHGDLEFVVRQKFLSGKRSLACGGREFPPVQSQEPEQDDADLPLGPDNELASDGYMYAQLKTDGRQPNFKLEVSGGKRLAAVLIGAAPGSVLALLSGTGFLISGFGSLVLAGVGGLLAVLGAGACLSVVRRLFGKRITADVGKPASARPYVTRVGKRSLVLQMVGIGWTATVLFVSTFIIRPAYPPEYNSIPAEDRRFIYQEDPEFARAVDSARINHFLLMGGIWAIVALPTFIAAIVTLKCEDSGVTHQSSPRVE